MTLATLKQLDEAQLQAEVARKQLEDALENYVTARHLHVEALRVHNETD